MRISSAVSRTHSTNAQRNKAELCAEVVEFDKATCATIAKNLISNIGMVNDNMVMGVTTMMVGGCQLHKSY